MSSKEEIPRAYDKEIYQILSSVGIPAKVHGYRYLLKAAEILLRNDSAVFAITKQVYMQIAEDYGINLKQVENSMRTAIERAWKIGRCDRHEMIFGYSRLAGRRPSNSEFLIRITEYLRNADK